MKVIEGRVLQTGLPDQCCDAVVMRMVAHHIADFPTFAIDLARVVKPGGRLVYATCSILQEENDAVAAHFERGHPEFTALSCAELLAAQRVELDTGERLRLYPHIHGTDGFFAVAFAKNSFAKAA